MRVYSLPEVSVKASGNLEALGQGAARGCFRLRHNL